MFGSSANSRFLVFQADSEQRKMQTYATDCCQALSPLNKSSDKSGDKLTNKSSYKPTSSTEPSCDVDDRLEKSPTFGRFSSRSGEREAHQSNMPLFQSTTELPAVKSDKVRCESQRSIGLPSNCNVTTGNRRSPSRHPHSPPADSNSNCSANCKKLSTMDLTSRIKLSDQCSCVRARHANCCVQNQSSFKPCANRSSAIHVDQTHRSDCPAVGRPNSSKDDTSAIDKSPVSRSAQRSSNESCESTNKSSSSPIKSSKFTSNRSLNSSIEPPSHHSSFSHISILSSFFRSSLSFTRNHQSLLVPLLLVLCTVIRMSGKCRQEPPFHLLLRQSFLRILFLYS